MDNIHQRIKKTYDLRLYYEFAKYILLDFSIRRGLL